MEGNSPSSSGRVIPDNSPHLARSSITVCCGAGVMSGDEEGRQVRVEQPRRVELGGDWQLWYAAYGSNLRLERLMYYIRGGRPPHGALEYPGCRDPRPPRRQVPVMLPGTVYFALEARAWTGGMAFYDPDEPGETPARAYLLTLEQFSDIAAQEMCRPPGELLDVASAMAHGRLACGGGEYDTLIYQGTMDGHPIFTFTAPWRRHAVTLRKPAPAYLRIIALGLMESHGWSPRATAAHLATLPGVSGEWAESEIVDLMVSGGDVPTHAGRLRR